MVDEPPSSERRVAPGLVVLILLGAFVALCCDGLRWDTPTVDEFAHLPAGYEYLQSGRFELFPLNPPLIKVLCALPLLALSPTLDPAPRIVNTGWYPWVFGTDFMQRNRALYDLIFLLGRLPVVGLGVFAGWLVWRWARALHGIRGGLIALLLFSFCPSLIAHAHLATPDVGTAAFFVAALFAVWRLLEQASWGRFALAVLALGAAELSKFSALLLYPVVAVLAVVALVRGLRFALPGFRERSAAASALTVGALFLGSLVVVDAGYLFEGVSQPVGQTVFQSRTLAHLAARLPAALPLPLPSAYLAGFDALELINEQGEFPTYLLGHWSRSGSPAYYLVALFFKNPLPLLALWILALLAGGRGATSVSRDRVLAESFLWFPALALLAFLSLGSKVQYGIRYVLPLLPLGCIYAARLAPVAGRRTPLGFATAVLLGIYPLSALLATPDTLAYFNLAAGGHGDRILLDSNLDWGQGLKRVRREMERTGQDEIALAYFGHVDPALYGIRWHFPDPRRSEVAAVSANFAYGAPYVTFANGRMTPVPPEAFSWIRRGPPPTDLGGGVFLYRTGVSSGGPAPAAPAAGPSGGASTATSPAASGSPPR